MPQGEFYENWNQSNVNTKNGTGPLMIHKSLDLFTDGIHSGKRNEGFLDQISCIRIANPMFSLEITQATSIRYFSVSYRNTSTILGVSAILPFFNNSNNSGDMYPYSVKPSANVPYTL
jgi:hypothetical protein